MIFCWKGGGRIRFYPRTLLGCVRRKKCIFIFDLLRLIGSLVSRCTKFTSIGCTKYTNTGCTRYTSTGCTKYTSTGCTKYTSTGCTKYTSTGCTKYTNYYYYFYYFYYCYHYLYNHYHNYRDIEISKYYYYNNYYWVFFYQSIKSKLVSHDIAAQFLEPIQIYYLRQ